MFNKKLIESLKSVINSLEDENKELKSKNEYLEKDNLLLLENSSELRKKVRAYEFLLEAEIERQKTEPKKKGRPKKEKANKTYEAYRQSYKTQHNKLKRNIDIGNIPENKLKERFDKWNEVAREKMDTCKTVEDYNEWYKQNINWVES